MPTAIIRSIRTSLLRAYAAWREYSAEYDRIMALQQTQRQATARHTARI